MTLWRRTRTHNAIYVQHQTSRQVRRYTPDKIATSEWNNGSLSSCTCA